MKKLISKLLLTCKKATELIEMEQEGLLSTTQKLQLKVHLKLCLLCKVYQTQSKNIQKLLQESFLKKHSPISNPELKEKISTKINNNF